MDTKQLETAKVLEKDIEEIQKCVDMFRPEGHCTPHRDEFNHRWSIGQFLMELVKPNKLKVNPQGFSGGGYIAVDKEFVDMCLNYFEQKLKDKKRQLADL